MELSRFRNLKEPYVMLLVGPPLSGKTTFYNEYLSKIDKDVVLISRDEILMEVYGSRNYSEAFKNVNQKLVNKVLSDRLSESSENGNNVMIDMTNMTSKRRIDTLSNFGDEYYKLAVIFPILSDEEYIKRNDKRVIEENKHLPMHVIKGMISSYKPVDKRIEGFDKIIVL